LLKVKKILKILIFLVIFIFVFSKVTYVLSRKESTWCIEPIYYEKKLDVIFVGPSTTDMSIRPMQLWEQEGIVSFNAGCEYNTFLLNYYNIEDFINRFSPKVIVMDVLSVNYMWDDKESLHSSLDKMKFSKSKIELINEVIPDNEKLEFLLPFISFHSNWKTIQQSDFEPLKLLPDKGVTYMIKVGDEKNVFQRISNNKSVKGRMIEDGYKIIPNTTEDAELNEDSKTYVDRIIKLCNDNDVKLLFIAMPTTEEGKRMEINALKSFVSNKYVEFIDFYELLDEIQFDATTDLIDSVHSSESGAIKITKYIGEWLKNKEWVTDRKKDPEFSEWHEYYEKSWYKTLYSNN